MTKKLTKAELEQRVKELEAEAARSGLTIQNLARESGWLREILDNMNLPVYLKSFDYRYLHVNRQYERLVNVRNHEVKGKSDYEIFPKTVADLFRSQDEEVKKANSLVEFTETVALADGEHTFITAKFPIKDTEGQIYAIGGVCTDITECKRIEEELRDIQTQLEERIRERTKVLEKTHEQLLHAEKLATSGSIAASFAHEFGNPLCGIKAVLGSIIQQESLPAGSARMVEMALEECERMNSLLQNLQDFNRPSTGEKSLTNVHRIIDDILVLSHRNLESRNIVVRKEYDSIMPPIMLITDQIKQVFMNLINNSIYACDSGGEIIICTSTVKDSITIRITDDGKGIKQDDLLHIFDPFFTTKPVALGTGLGLSVSYGIVRHHGGTIEVTSKPGDGSTFTIILPLNTQDACVAKQPAPCPPKTLLSCS